MSSHINWQNCSGEIVQISIEFRWIFSNFRNPKVKWKFGRKVQYHRATDAQTSSAGDYYLELSRVGQRNTVCFVTTNLHLEIYFLA